MQIRKASNPRPKVSLFGKVMQTLLLKGRSRSNSHGSEVEISFKHDRAVAHTDQQRKPFQLLYDQSDDSDEEVYLVPLRVHLERSVVLFSKLQGLPSASFSTGCFANLHMAASLHGLDVDTDITDDGMWCGNVSNYEGVKSEIVGAFVAGRLAFEMVFHAYEVLGQQYCNKSRSVTTQQISRRLMSDGMHRPLYGFSEITYAAVSRLPFELDTRSQDSQQALSSSSKLGLGAECVRQFRNALVHGRLQAPDPVDWHGDNDDSTAASQADMYRSQIRLCLLLIQIIVERLVGSIGVEDSQFQEFTVRDIVACLHIQDAYHDDEDDPDEPVLTGIQPAPRFHYW